MADRFISVNYTPIEKLNAQRFSSDRLALAKVQRKSWRRTENEEEERLPRCRERSLAFIWIFVMKMASAAPARGKNRKIKRRIEWIFNG